MNDRETKNEGLLTDKYFSSWRLLVQSSFALFCLYCGWRFYLFYQWALGNSPTYVTRPPSVEGFLPISALVSLKRLILTGNYDQIHPAGLTIFLAALFLAVFLRKGFCGWICPVGFTSNLVEKAGRKLKLLKRLPDFFDYPMMALKYLLLGFFSFLILIKMNLTAIESFNRSPYNLVVDAKMLLFFLEPGHLTVFFLAAILLSSLFLRNFWCRYLCPYGALLGILSMFGPLRINRDQESCINCKKCEKMCPGSIRVHQEVQVESPECIGCLECVATCPVPNCLTVSIYSRKKLPPRMVPLGVVGIFLLFWLVALTTGHWHNGIDPAIMQEAYRIGSNLGHP
ncbi:MAG: 4Fe-4S binding protein [Proteobacteria bacterium]|nr:4Fe-4S binding protein [Pseudomonadota bacterium]MBU1687137.1 4Fe-4S binding protein [Pseudomonadota bacterium]